MKYRKLLTVVLIASSLGLFIFSSPKISFAKYVTSVTAVNPCLTGPGQWGVLVVTNYNDLTSTTVCTVPPAGSGYHDYYPSGYYNLPPTSTNACLNVHTNTANLTSKKWFGINNLISSGCPATVNMDPTTPGIIKVLNPGGTAITLVAKNYPEFLNWNVFGHAAGMYGLTGFQLDTSSGFTGLSAYPYLSTNSAADLTKINQLIAQYGKITLQFNNAYTVDVPMVPPIPTITSVTPNPVLIGSLVTINGTEFLTAGNTVTISGASSLGLTNQSNTATKITGTLSDLAPPASDGSYGFTVSNANGTSNAVYTNVINPKKDPTYLSAVRSTAEIEKINLSWYDNSTGETGFQIQRAVDVPGTAFSLITTTSPNATTYTDNLNTVATIGKTNKYRVRAAYSDGTFSNWTNIGSVSNCVKLPGGDGPNKIYFMQQRLDVNSPSVTAFVNNINKIINGGFKAIDPFAKYSHKFSYYVDLRQFEAYLGNYMSNPVYARDASSCGTDADEYVAIAKGKSTESMREHSGTNFDYSMIVFNSNFFTSEPVEFPWILMHEMGHTYGKLDEEYFEDTGTNVAPTSTDTTSEDQKIAGAFQFYDPYKLSPKGEGTQCTTKPNKYYVGLDGHMYGSASSTPTKGCKFVFNEYLKPVYRPSHNSLMNHDPAGQSDKFNVISCGYITAGILHELPDRKHAQKYWPDCLTIMNTVKDGITDPIPKVVPSSTKAVKKTSSLHVPSTFAKLFESVKYALLAQVSQSTIIPLAAGDGIVVSGSGFTATDNAAQLISTKNPSEVSLIYEIPSPDRTSISFDIPTTTPEGTYSLKVVAFNSDWVSTGATLSVVGYSGAINPTVNIVTRIAGRVLTSAEANGCVANRTLPNGTKSAGGCVYTLTNQPLGSYNVEWLSGYPIGADKTKRPTISPPYPQTLGVRPAGSNPLTYYIDFAAAPTSIVNVVARLDGTALLPTVNGTCSAIIKNPSGVTSAGTCTRTLTGQSLGTYSVTWSGGYPTGADTTKQPTIATPTLVLNATSTGNKINFYLDFVGQSKPALQNLTATVAGKSINLTWNNPNGLTGDMMPEQSQKNPTTGTWSSWTNANTDGCDKDSCTIYIGIAQGTIYKFRVRVYDPATSAYSGYSNETAEVSLSTPPPTASLTIQGLHNYVYAPSQGIRYKWSSTDADTFSVSYTSNSAPWCGNANSSIINSANGESAPFIFGQIHLGCIWTVTYTARDSKTGRTASDMVTVSVTQQGTTGLMINNLTGGATPSAPVETPSVPVSTAPTASFTIEGQHSYTYHPGQTNHYKWSSTGVADTYSSSYTSTGPSQCGGGPWVANTPSGESSSYVSSAYLGCVWTVTYTAKNSVTGQSASDTVVVSVTAQ